MTAPSCAHRAAQGYEAAKAQATAQQERGAAELAAAVARAAERESAAATAAAEQARAERLLQQAVAELAARRNAAAQAADQLTKAKVRAASLADSLTHKCCAPKARRPLAGGRGHSERAPSVVFVCLVARRRR